MLLRKRGGENTRELESTFYKMPFCRAKRYQHKDLRGYPFFRGPHTPTKGQTRFIFICCHSRGEGPCSRGLFRSPRSNKKYTSSHPIRHFRRSPSPTRTPQQFRRPIRRNTRSNGRLPPQHGIKRRSHFHRRPSPTYTKP